MSDVYQQEPSSIHKGGAVSHPVSNEHCYSLLKMAIADDERFIRNGLACLDWESLGIEARIVANGLEVLELARSCALDILLTDIRMPGLDGLELIRLLQNICPNCKSLILTGYPDFFYAQKAIEYGAVGFILKPAENKDILSAVSKCAQQVWEQRKYRSDYLSLVEQVRRRNSVDIALKRLINANMLTQEDIRVLNLKILSDVAYTAVIFTLDKEFDAGAFKAIMSSVMSNAWYTHYSPESQCVIYRHIQINDPEVEIKELCHEVLEALMYCGCSVHAGIGNTVNCISRIHESYLQAKQCTNLFFSHGENMLICFSDVCDKLNDDGDIPEYVVHCLSAIEAHNNDLLSLNLERIRQSYAKSVFVEENYIKYTFIDIYNSAIQILSKDTYSYEDRRMDVEIFDQISAATDLDSLCSLMHDFLVPLCNSTSEPNTNRDFVDLAIEIMKTNYAEELGLKKIADRIHVNPQYLSRKIKERTGMSYIQLLTSIRLKKACLLITEGNMPFFELCRAVGVPDFRYFSRVFRKLYGMSPSQYRKTSRKQTQTNGERKK